MSNVCALVPRKKGWARSSQSLSPGWAKVAILQYGPKYTKPSICTSISQINVMQWISILFTSTTNRQQIWFPYVFRPFDIYIVLSMRLMDTPMCFQSAYYLSCGGLMNKKVKGFHCDRHTACNYQWHNEMSIDKWVNNRTEKTKTMEQNRETGREWE